MHGEADAMAGNDEGDVEVPFQVYCELETMQQMGTYDMASEDVLDGLEEYDFHAARDWVVEHPDEYIRVIEGATRSEPNAGAGN